MQRLSDSKRHFDLDDHVFPLRYLTKNLMCLFLLVVFSNMILAQNQPKNPVACPPGKACTVFLWMNGVLGGPTSNEWEAKVKGYKSAYFATHDLPLDDNLVKFDFVFNKGGTGWGTLGPDLSQSNRQMALLLLHEVDINDPDFVALLDAIQAYSSKGYKVIGVGHSQGTLYMDLAYQGIRDKKVGTHVQSITFLPDNNKFQIVNIATPWPNVPDGNGMYTTQCGDGILKVTDTLPANINNGYQTCASGGESHLIYWHLLDTYLIDRSLTQKQIFADLDLALGLPNPGCIGDYNCFFRDNFANDYSTTNYLANYRQMGNLKLAESSGISTGAILGGIGSLDLLNLPTPNSSEVSLRTRPIFKGEFTLSLRYSSSGASNKRIALINAATNKLNPPAAFWDLGPLSNNGDWHTLVLTRTSSQISVTVDGTAYAPFNSNMTDGYYIYFDLKDGINNLQIRNLSVIRNIGTVNITSDVATSCKLNGNIAVSAPGSSTQPIGNQLLTCSAPPGYKVTSIAPNSQELSAGAIARFAVTLTAIPTEGTIVWAPENYSLNVTQGGPGVANVTLKSQNGLSGSANLSLNCTNCAPNFEYKFPTVAALPANGSVTVQVNFTDHNNSPGLYNYQYKARVGPTAVAIANISVKVVALPPMIVNCAFAWSPAVVGEANSVIGTWSGGAAQPVAITLNNFNTAGPLTVFANSVGSLIVTVKGTDNIGRTASNTCLIPAVAMPTPVLSSLTVNSSPKKGIPIKVTLAGSGFVHGSQVRYCDSPAFGTNCPGATVTYVNGNQLALPGITWYVPATIYVRVVNPGNLSSGVKTLVVTN